MLAINNNVKARLDTFCTTHKIPNIIFHGPSGCGKSYIMKDFIDKIYNNQKELVDKYVMYVNCAYGKGIKFIRDELKFFAKTNIYSSNHHIFKTIVLFNADKLTIDAQSALRRCIELFTHTTRLFIVIEDQSKLMKPILSRFCSIHVPNPIYQNEPINLYTYNVTKIFPTKQIQLQKYKALKKVLSLVVKETSKDILDLSICVYESGHSAIDIIQMVKKSYFDDCLSDDKVINLIFIFNKMKREIRHETLLIFFVLNFIFIGVNNSLENISFM